MAPKSAKGKGKTFAHDDTIEQTTQNLLDEIEVVSTGSSSLSDPPDSCNEQPSSTKPAAASSNVNANKNSTPSQAEGKFKNTKTLVLTPDDFANGQPGGFIKPPASRKQIMKWTAENKDKLLLLGLGRTTFTPDELQKIADSFPEKPTKKAIQEQFQKLRKARNEQMAKMGYVWVTKDGKRELVPPSHHEEDLDEGDEGLGEAGETGEETGEDRLALAHRAGFNTVEELEEAEQAERERQDGEDLYDD